MKITENYPKLREYLLSFNGVKSEITENGELFKLVSKPIALITDETVEITAKADYNETIRVLHGEITESEIMGGRFNSVRYGKELPFEVITDMIDRAYRLTYSNLPKKIQREIDEYYHNQ